MSKTQITIKIAGDSGDGIQLSGHRLAMIQALFGHDVATFADYPAEIRAPKGTLYGVSAYQIQVGVQKVLTPGDTLDILVALSQAAYEVWNHKLKDGGLLIVDKDVWSAQALEELENHKRHRLIDLPMTTCLYSLFKQQNLKKKQILQTKNFFALGVLCWLLERDIQNTTLWIQQSSPFTDTLKQINSQALNEGYTASLVREMIPFHLSLPIHCSPSNSKHRFINGNSAIACGLIAAARQSHRTLFYSSYPITPASSLLHELANLNEPDMITHQAEDEIAAIGCALGASYGGSLGVVGTSGPGMALMSEFIGLTVMAERPLVVIDVQRAGPSTGMPTKTSQGDLNLALSGRHDSSPVVVLAMHSPQDGFHKAFLASQIAIQRNCVVVVLSDATLAGSHEIWTVPHPDDLDTITAAEIPKAEDFKPYEWDPHTLSVPWVACGTKGYEHIIGGLEKTPSGHISYDGVNHQTMINRRQQKIDATVDLMPDLMMGGDLEADTLMVSWGSSAGPIKQFVYAHRLSCQPSERLAFVHLESLSPFQKQLGDVLNRYKTVVVIENNLGQATAHLRNTFAHITFHPILKSDGLPWSQQELKTSISSILSLSPSPKPLE